MTDHAAHLQEIFDAAAAAAKAAPTSANIAAVEKARKAIEEYAAAGSVQVERFATQAAALEYLQRTYQIEKSKLSKDVQAGKVPKKDGFFHAKELDFYAQAAHLRLKTITVTQTADSSDRLKLAMAIERELRTAQLQGQLIDAAEEEARDAKLWYAVRTDIENHAPAIVGELINRIAALQIPEEYTERILLLAPELSDIYEDALAEIFDRYDKQGGIEA